MPRLAPSRHHAHDLWFNLRRVQDYSPTAALADPATEKRGLGAFLRAYGVEPVVDQLAEPLARFREYLSQPGGDGPSRFCDGSFRVVYLGDSEAACLAEVTHHLARSLGDSDAEKARAHYFVLAQFELAGATLDVRKGFPHFHLPDDWGPAQAFGAQARSQGGQGVTYRSVRLAKASNVGVLMADLVHSGTRVRIVGLRWNGTGLVEL